MMLTFAGKSRTYRFHVSAKVSQISVNKLTINYSNKNYGNKVFRNPDRKESGSGFCR